MHLRQWPQLIVPELQRRGRYRKEYTPGTLREQVLGQGPRLAPTHAGRQVRIGVAGEAAPLKSAA